LDYAPNFGVGELIRELIYIGHELTVKEQTPFDLSYLLIDRVLVVVKRVDQPILDKFFQNMGCPKNNGGSD
jgi:hypothetical protein